MNQSESIAKLAPALVAAVAEMGPVSKSGNNTFDRYTYAKLEDYVKAVAPVLAKHDLCLMSGVPEVFCLESRTTRNGGTENACRARLTMRLLHKSGEWIEAESFGEGQDRADKATYKAITGARKYGIASLLGLATSDDPESDEQVGQSKGAARGTPTKSSARTPRNVPEVIGRDAPVPPPEVAETGRDWRAGLTAAEVIERDSIADSIWNIWKDAGGGTALKSLDDVHRAIRHRIHKRIGTAEITTDHYRQERVAAKAALEKHKSELEKKARASHVPATAGAT